MREKREGGEPHGPPFFVRMYKAGRHMVVIQEQEFREFADYVKTNYGIYFKNEKRRLWPEGSTTSFQA